MTRIDVGRERSGMSAVALCIICHDREDELETLLESTAGHSFDEIVVIDMASEPPLRRLQGVHKWTRSDVNLGVPEGRNRLADLADSDILYFVDDDAVLTDGPDQAEALRSIFGADATLGAVAGLVVRPSGRIERQEFPFPGPAADIARSRPGGCFLGGCHALRKLAGEQVGGNDGRFFYSTEEVDLSTRLHRHGWSILYHPDISIEHRPSTTGRAPAPEILTMRLRNRILHCRKNLPWAMAAVHIAVWSIIVGMDAVKSRDLRAWLAAWRPGLTWPVQRDPLTWSQASALHRLGGRAWR